MKKLTLLVFCILFLAIESICSQQDSLTIKDFLIGLNFRSILPDSIRPSNEDLEELSEYFSFSVNYKEIDKQYLLKIVNDTFPEKELLHKYKIEIRYREEIDNEVRNILENTKKDSLVVLDSVYQAYYKRSSIRKLALPLDIDFMLGLANDPRFVPFLKKRYQQGYQNAGFALARMGETPYVDKILAANVFDSVRYYGDPWWGLHRSINFNPNLLLYVCSADALDLYVDYILQNNDFIVDHTYPSLKDLTNVDETGLGRNYEYQVVLDLREMLVMINDSTLNVDYETHIKKLKNNLLSEIKDLPEKEYFIYSRFIALTFPYRSNFADLQKIRTFVEENRTRFTNPATCKCQEYWQIKPYAEDFRVRRYR